jgi:hypothetical protein
MRRLIPSDLRLRRLITGFRAAQVGCLAEAGVPALPGESKSVEIEGPDARGRGGPFVKLLL